MRFTKKLRDRWVAALRSGHYRQGHGQLKTLDGRYCCLGVLCDVAGISVPSFHPNEKFGGYLKDAGDGANVLVSDAAQEQLACANDSGDPEFNFNNIADYIEQNIVVKDGKGVLKDNADSFGDF